MLKAHHAFEMFYIIVMRMMTLQVVTAFLELPRGCIHKESQQRSKLPTKTPNYSLLTQTKYKSGNAFIKKLDSTQCQYVLLVIEPIQQTFLTSLKNPEIQGLWQAITSSTSQIIFWTMNSLHISKDQTVR